MVASNERSDKKKEIKPFLTCWNIHEERFKIINEECAKELDIIKR